MRRRGIALATGALLLGLLTGCGSISFTTPHPTANHEAAGPSGQAPSSPAGPNASLTLVEVVRVVDGDTLEVLLDGKTEDLRLIGIDTPETVHPSKPVQPYGPEASAFTKAQLTGKQVGLEFDVEERDRYGRLLAYVWLGDQMFNRILVQEGYAQVATFPPNVRHVDEFTALQKEARAAKRGLWALPVASEPMPTQAPPTGSGTGAPPTWQPEGGQCVWGGQEQIKGNINSSGEKIYHAPGQRYYKQTGPETCFATGQDAEAAGYRASRQ